MSVSLLGSGFFLERDQHLHVGEDVFQKDRIKAQNDSLVTMDDINNECPLHLQSIKRDELSVKINIFLQTIDLLDVEKENKQTKYKLIRKKGEGAIGKVFRAVDMENLMPVAIKINKAYPNTLENLNNEFRFLSRAQKIPNVIKIIEFINLDNYFFNGLVLDYSNFELFHILLKYNNGLSADFVLNKLAKTFLNILVELKKISIIHGDLKPSNIGYSNYYNKFLLFDFSLAKDSDEEQTSLIQSRFYRAFEVAMQIPYNHMNVDLFSLGCILFEAYTGCILFPICYNSAGKFDNETANVYLQMLAKYLGDPPNDLIEMSPKKDIFFEKKDGKYVFKKNVDLNKINLKELLRIKSFLNVDRILLSIPGYLKSLILSFLSLDCDGQLNFFLTFLKKEKIEKLTDQQSQEFRLLKSFSFFKKISSIEDGIRLASRKKTDSNEAVEKLIRLIKSCLQYHRSSPEDFFALL